MVDLTGKETGDEIVALRRKASGHPSLLLNRRAVAEFLRRCADGELSASELTLIANELEATDEIDYEAGAEETIASVLFEVASPEINQKATPDRCATLIKSLASDDRT